EEKRQEVESQMAALVAPGAPVSVLLDYGMSDAVAEKLVEAGVGTIERLGSMTPEELELIPGIDPASVEFIQAAVVAYYSQFEDPGEAEPEPQPDHMVEAQAEEIAETEGSEAAGTDLETVETSGTIEDADDPTQPAEGRGA